MALSADDAAVIVEVLCSQALADHLGDVRDAEEDLWRLLGAPRLPYDHFVSDESAWTRTRARLKLAGYELPSCLSD
jgi:hypothetical protein